MARGAKGPNSGTFKPGHKGLGGRPRMPVDVKEAFKALTMLAKDTLEEVCRNPKTPPAARAMAAQAILDRGHGKPTQHLEANVNILDKLADAEQRGLAAALAHLAGESEDAPTRTETTH